jgi:uncharacterized protein (TIGR02145 family)
MYATAARKLSCIIAVLLPFSLLAQKAGETVKDADGNSYHSIQIGSQTWLKENLKTQRFRNGDKILSLPITTDWSDFTKAAMSEKAKNNYQSAYGRHYNWYSVADSRGLCPVGYRIPSRQDFLVLLDFTGRKKERWSEKSIFSQGEAENIGGKLKAVSKFWLPPNPGANNQSGFTALPAGYRAHDFEDLGLTAWFWTSTEFNTENADGMVLSNESSGARLTYHFKTNGFSVRCIKE